MRAARGAILQFVRKLVSPLPKFQPLVIPLALLALFCAAPPGIVLSQNPPAKDNLEDAVQTQMRNVTFRFSDNVAVEIKSLNGVLVPLGKNEFPNFDDKDSFKLRVSTGEIAMESSDLANVLNSYVFARPHSPLTELSIRVEKGHLRVKGKLHDKGDMPFETEGSLIPTADGKIRLHSEKIKAMHLPVKGLMDLFGIDLGSLIKEGKVPGVEAQEDDLVLDLEQILPPPHIEGKVVSIRMEGEKIVQTFGGSDVKPMKNILIRNYMAFKNNRIRLGKLVMNDTDLVLIDMDPNDPLDFYLDHYKEQLAAGYSKLTLDSGLRVHIKDYNKLHPAKASPVGDKTK
ncbi:MAG TPA: hypothetical protein VNH65_06030 [Candidatus Acidoferrum sp.]|nr:hypothetical protein [Candidatus Acidoferrum sp.]